MKNTGKKPELQRGLYRHYKGGIYQVLEVACHTETLEWYVVYESQERKAKDLPSVWLRPYDMFIEKITIDGNILPRFEKVN